MSSVMTGQNSAHDGNGRTTHTIRAVATAAATGRMHSTSLSHRFSRLHLCARGTASGAAAESLPRGLLVRADPRPVFGEHASAAQFRPPGRGRLHWAHLHFRCSIFASAAMNRCVRVVIIQPTTWTLHHRPHESDMLQFRD